MRALVATGPGGPADLRVDDVAAPEPRDGQVLIDVRYAGLAFADTLMIRGQYQVRLEYPFVPGFEVAGVVSSAPAWARVAPGDEVIAFTGIGAFAEQAVADAAFVLPRPAELDWPSAAGFMGNTHTAWYSLIERGRLAPGDTVLVHGAAGGVGQAACQIAAAVGARVIAVVSSDARANAARGAGADEVVILSADWAAEVRERTGGRGVEVVLDTIGGDRTEPSLRLLVRHGRLLVVGFVAGQVPKLALQRVLNSDADVVGVAWPTAAAADPMMTLRMQRGLAPLLARGQVTPHVSGVYRLEDAPDAYRAIEAREVVGKLVLEVA